MANFDISYVLYALVIAAIVIVLVYFSKVEEDEPPKSKAKRVLQIENKPDPREVDQLKQRLNEQIEHHDREYQQTLIQIREAENNRKIEYGRQVDNLRTIETKLMNDKNELMQEKEKFLQEKIDFQKQQLESSAKSGSKPRSKKHVKSDAS